jgi:hypothetical protein
MTGMSMKGKMSTGIVMMEATPRSKMAKDITTKV